MDARYRFKVGLLTFSNPSNTDSNGAACDIFNSDCEYVFRFCLSENSATNCILGSTVTQPHHITSNSYTFTLGQPLIPGASYTNPLVYTDVAPQGNPWPVSLHTARIQNLIIIVYACKNLLVCEYVVGSLFHNL